MNIRYFSFALDLGGFRVTRLSRIRHLVPTSTYWLLLGVACTSEPNEHPPFCNEPRCIPDVAIKRASSAGASSVDANPSAAAGAGIELVGRIVEFDEAGTSTNTAPATGNFTVTALMPDATPRVTKGLAAEFSLPRVARSSAAWLAVKPENRADLLPGIVAFNSSSAASPLAVVISLARRGDLESLGLSLTSMVTLDTTKAQVILRFTNPRGTPLAGVTVAMVGAERMAFDLGVSYTDDAIATGKRGITVLLNVDATSTPALRAVSLGGSLVGEVLVPLWAGAASVVQIASAT
ncbi:MAG: hypothetical protein ACM3ZE_09110 [Myxococcales bacterium]